MTTKGATKNGQGSVEKGALSVASLAGLLLLSNTALAGTCELPFRAVTLDATIGGITSPREMRIDSSRPCPRETPSTASCYSGKYKSLPQVPDSQELELFVKAYANETVDYEISVAGFSPHLLYVGSCASDSPWFVSGDIYEMPSRTLMGTFRMMTTMP
jgi:hypothetical protein